MRSLTVGEALTLIREGKVLLVDVRSEKEFLEATIPGAVNIPLLRDAEREQVGITYKYEGPAAAKRLGLSLVAARLPEMVTEFDRQSAGRPVVLFCWRGGLRSQFVAFLLDFMGLTVYRIAGGYKAYRRCVTSYFDCQMLPHRVVVIHGLTGVGKTLLLYRLKQRGLPVLDLEGLAHHRGSVFGHIGLPPSPGQKMFESLIFEELQTAEPVGVIIVECESRRIGKLFVPPALYAAMQAGYRVLVYASTLTRVKRLIEEYTSGPEQNVPQLIEATRALTRYLGKKTVEDLGKKLEERKFEEVFTYLLEKHYDPLYRYPDQPSPEYDLCVNAEDLEEAANHIAHFVRNLPEYGRPVLRGGEANGNWCSTASGTGSTRDDAGRCGSCY